MDLYVKEILATGEEFAIDNDNGYRSLSNHDHVIPMQGNRENIQGKVFRNPAAGDRRGQHSIRINEQWSVCFVRQDGDANDVGIVDYH
jgi:hypothetical protein